MTRHVDAAFRAFVGLDPITSGNTSGCLDPIGVSAASDVDTCIARIVAMPRGNPATECTARHDQRPYGTPQPSRPRNGVRGLALAVAVVVVAIVLWVSPSAGAPPRHGISPIAVGHVEVSPPELPDRLAPSPHEPTGATAIALFLR